MGKELTLEEFLDSRFKKEVDTTKRHAEKLKEEYENSPKKLGKRISCNLPYGVITILRELSDDDESTNIVANEYNGSIRAVIETMGCDMRGGEKNVDLGKIKQGFIINKNFPTLIKNITEALGGNIDDGVGKIPYKKVFDEVEKYKIDGSNGYWVSKIMKCLSWDEWKGNEGMNVSNENTINKSLEELINNGSKQIIFTGAPGTGKTYSVREYVKAEVKGDEERYKFVQFHPSYDYSDFVEGLRPVCVKDSDTPTFVRLDGTFKAFCRKIVEENLRYAYGLNETEHNELEKDKLDKIIKNLKKPENTADTERKFNEGKDKYFFIVDEINRADLSKVFGELMFGLEESYRGIVNRFDTQYKNLKTYEVDEDGKGKILEFDCFENGFFIPHNLYFIGIMNDIDRSVESFDFALRRRFQWIDIKANDVMESALISMLGTNEAEDSSKVKDIVDKIKAMNEVIDSDEFAKFGLSEAYHIGPAYFKDLDLNDPNSMQNIFDHKIVSILREYTRGRKSQDVEDLLKACAGKLGVNYGK